MSITEGYTARLERELRAIAEPLVQQLNDIDGEIEGMATELAELRKHRSHLATVLRSIDPALVPSKPKKQERPKGQVVTAEEVENVKTWLEANPPNGDGIWATRLSEDTEFRNATGIRSGVIAQALAELHEQSFLTLVRMGRGGSKIYEVVT